MRDKAVLVETTILVDYLRGSDAGRLKAGAAGVRAAGVRNRFCVKTIPDTNGT